MTPFAFHRRNRSALTAVILLCIYAGLICLHVFLGAVWWLLALLFLPTIPALLDFVKNTSAGMELRDGGLTWHSGTRTGGLALAEIDRFRFDTRWDFSVRVSAILKSGKKIRLPDESLPPHLKLEATLQDAGFTVERHHFRVF